MLDKIKTRREQYAQLTHENLKITIYLSTPVAVIGYLPLDGFLAYAVMKDIYGEGFYNLPDKPSGGQLIDVPLPLKDNTAENGRKYWSASFGIFQGAESVSKWKKRWDDKNDDIVDFGKKQEKVKHKSGWMKAYDMPLVIHSTPGMTFYARGNKTETGRLLSLVTHLGKKKAQGYGRIRNIKIEQRERDNSCYTNGCPARSIPVREDAMITGEHPVMYTGHRPPYWAPENQALCCVP